MKYIIHKHLLLGLLAAVVISASSSISLASQAPKRSFKDIANEAKAKADSIDMRTKLEKAQRFDGMFTAWIDSAGKLFLQLPDNLSSG